MMAVAAGAMREGWIPMTNPGGRNFHRPIGFVTSHQCPLANIRQLLTMEVVRLSGIPISWVLRLLAGHRDRKNGTLGYSKTSRESKRRFLCDLLTL